MITENIILRLDLKKKLKHLAIDNDTHVSLMLIDGADFVMNGNKPVPEVSSEDDFEAFTMKIDKEFKGKIKEFCRQQDVKIKDFWNEVAYIVVEMEGYNV